PVRLAPLALLQSVTDHYSHRSCQCQSPLEPPHPVLRSNAVHSKSQLEPLGVLLLALPYWLDLDLPSLGMNKLGLQKLLEPHSYLELAPKLKCCPKKFPLELWFLRPSKWR